MSGINSINISAAGWDIFIYVFGVLVAGGSLVRTAWVLITTRSETDDE